MHVNFQHYDVPVSEWCFRKHGQHACCFGQRGRLWLRGEGLRSVSIVLLHGVYSFVSGVVIGWHGGAGRRTGAQAGLGLRGLCTGRDEGLVPRHLVAAGKSIDSKRLPGCGRPARQGAQTCAGKAAPQGTSAPPARRPNEGVEIGFQNAQDPTVPDCDKLAFGNAAANCCN
jgi:hypothetical protein